MSVASVEGRIKAIEASQAQLHKKLDGIGSAVKSVHEQTVASVPWIPSLVVAFVLVYPVEALILETAKDHKISAWASGWILDAKEFTAKQGLKSGIQFVGGTTEYSSPLSKKLIVTSSFNPRRKHPVTGKITPHNGTDVRCSRGNVYAIQSGVVKFAASKGAAGKMVVIQHATGDKSIYMHLHRISVRNGERVSTGEKIGLCGQSGRVTGPHLHLAIMNKKGKYIDPVTVVGITQAADMWEYFKDTVALSESQGSGGYSAVSKSGTFVGRYQMDRSTINYAGFKHVSMKKFKATPDVQDEVYRAWQAKNLQLFRNGKYICESTTGKLKKAFNKGQCDKQYGNWQFIRGFINSSTPAHVVAGALHAAQFGPSRALRWYSSKVEFKDGNGVAISTYAARGEKAFKSKYGRFASAAPLLKSIERGL